MPPTLPAKKFKFGAEARDDMMKGITLMRNAVTATLGPNGRNVAIDRYMVNDLTKDGVTVLADVVAEEQFTEMGCKMVREASTKTNDEAGDGTTTAIEIAYAMAEAGRKKLQTGTNVIKLQDGMQKAMDAVVECLKSQAIKVETDQQYIDVATIASQDEIVGKKVAEIFLASGENGVIDIERVDKPGIETEHTDGMQIMEGWVRHEFINDFANLSYVMDDVPVIVTDREITANPELVGVEMLARKGIKKCVIICDDCNGEALGTLVKNAHFGAFHCCVIKAPGWGPRKGEMLKDIAAMTGATVISEENGLNLDQIEMTHIGRARQITVRQKKTTIIANREHKQLNPASGEEVTVDKLIETRVELLKKQIEVADEGFEKDKMKERLASMTDGVSLIKNGANTEIERILMKRKIEDAIRAVQCAKEEGIVAGGGAALLKCVDTLNAMVMDDPDEQLGVQIVAEAIQSPAYRILEVAGVEPEQANFFYSLTPGLRKKWMRKCHESIVKTVRSSHKKLGYDMSRKGYHFIDLIDKGVVDPVKVVRTAFLNGGSCAKSYLSIEVAISPVQDSVANKDNKITAA